MWLRDQALRSKYIILEAIMCCTTFDLPAILKDGPIKQYYFCILRESVIPMSYDLRIVEL